MHPHLRSGGYSVARIVVGVSGASGIVLAHRAVQWLVDLGHEVDLVISRAAFYTATLEMGKEFASVENWMISDQVTYYRNNDFSAPMASGSVLHDGMLLIPCSMASLGAIAMGLSDNLLRRAADVCLKERRKLVIVPRETPLSSIHLENMLKVTNAGATILPPEPAWYLKQKTIEEVEDYIVGRAFDALRLEAPFCPRWDVNKIL